MLHYSSSFHVNSVIGVWIVHEVEYLLMRSVHVLKRIVIGTQFNVCWSIWVYKVLIIVNSILIRSAIIDDLAR